MLAFVDIRERKDTFVMDGYTTNKTWKGVVRDIARAVEKYDPGEARWLMDVVRLDENPFLTAIDGGAGWFCEWEEVPRATRYDENTGENEYKEGYNNYFVYSFYKDELNKDILK